jgi:hypothetical protein
MIRHAACEADDGRRVILGLDPGLGLARKRGRVQAAFTSDNV